MVMEKLKSDIVIAMKDKSLKNRLTTLKNILDTAQKHSKERKSEMTDEDVVFGAKREVKQLNETLSFVKDEPAAQELREMIEVANEFLPKMATEKEIVEFILSNKETSSNIGLMMRALKEKFGDSLDGRIASKLVKENL